ncbi:TPA: DUF969 domain-containing protein [Streptococcus pyogenes]|uniref:DUF969 domain-containing protein n=1 Tax=Streptococcus pyogenes TaxID=1314 RepID=UPI0004D19017|nr:DUF969 domain-containing protein [Streptococcus pyogenes]HER4566398.1 DUF969 domain-containing protein [Streptococcus pyogenes NGAS629]HER4574486.1 DUF969 domain-containing protein [Streptococcus pyogenes NGAS643]HER4577724.1 DUF969 domain-containing protein [Streptococcus pyogenes NGAS633]HER4583210.1 DUF969 domain-containing protein [Streptococcus pyogenes NGAS655]HER4604126.1 DUF969 domain-containing protein [Streptococcus pyogenes NGAS620]HER4713339.1 DUF969 domain-containing protein [
MEWIKLIGIMIIVLGFILKFDAIATVVVAGLVTALVSGISFIDFLDILGKEFTNQRLLTIFFITLPLIGLSETYGLKHRATQLIQRVQALTVGRLLTLYLIIRELAGLFSIRLGGHPQFVRPLIQPMGEAAAKANIGEELTDAEKDDIKAMAAANENFGNFFAQNTFVGAGGVLLIAGTLEQLGYDGNQAKIAFSSILIAIISIIIVAIYNYLFEKKMERQHQKGDN